MAIYDLLPKFDYIEPNNLKGLQAGLVVAQMPVAETASALLKDVNGTKFMENGTICAISKDGIVAPTASDKADGPVHSVNSVYKLSPDKTPDTPE